MGEDVRHPGERTVVCFDEEKVVASLADGFLHCIGTNFVQGFEVY